MKIPEIILVESAHQPGSLAKILGVIGDAGVTVEGLRQIRRDHEKSTWEITLELEEGQSLNIVQGIDSLPNAKILGTSDRVFERHKGGKIKTVSTIEINSLERLRDVYTPGVARVCLAIQKNPEKVWDYTALGKTVAIVTNGTAILGLGHIGALAGLPVMEGKAALLAELVGLYGVPILIENKDPKVIIDTVTAIAPSFGAIQLEDIAAPECFLIEEELRKRIDKPVMHDDQHGTATVVLAALLSATRRVGIELRDAVVGQIGLGAAGLGISRLLRNYGVKSVLGTDVNDSAMQRFKTLGGTPTDLPTVMKQARIVIATTGKKGLIRSDMIQPGQLIFALSNPEPEIEASAARAAGAAFAADGRLVNNVLGFPGIFLGLLQAHATKITDSMLIAAAQEISGAAPENKIVPDALDKQLHQKVAKAVANVAVQ